MQDIRKTKAQLIEELTDLRRQVAQLPSSAGPPQLMGCKPSQHSGASGTTAMLSPSATHSGGSSPVQSAGQLQTFSPGPQVPFPQSAQIIAPTQGSARQTPSPLGASQPMGSSPSQQSGALGTTGRLSPSARQAGKPVSGSVTPSPVLVGGRSVGPGSGSVVPDGPGSATVPPPLVSAAAPSS